MTRRRFLLLVALILVLAVRLDAAIVFLWAGGFETLDTSLSSNSGTVAYSSFSHASGGSYRINTSSNAAFATNLLTTSGRGSLWVAAQIYGLGSVNTNVSNFLTVGTANGLWTVRIESTDVGTNICVADGAAAQPTLKVCGTGTGFTAQKWHRVAFAWTVTSTSNFTIKAWLYDSDGTTQLDTATATNANGSITAAGTTSLTVWGDTNGNADADQLKRYVTELYLDDSNALTAAGNIEILARVPTTGVTNTFDTLSSGSSPHLSYVDDKPLSTSRYLKQAASSQATESFTAEGTSEPSEKQATYTAWGPTTYSSSTPVGSTTTAPGQSFTGLSGDLAAIYVPFKRTTGTPTDFFHLEILDNHSTGTPDWTSFSGDASAITDTTRYTWVRFGFENLLWGSIPLVAGHTYYIYVVRTTVDASNFLSVGKSGSDTYASGTTLTATWDGSTFSSAGSDAATDVAMGIALDRNLATEAAFVGHGTWAWAAGQNVQTTPVVTPGAVTTSGTAANTTGACVGKATGTTCATASMSNQVGDLCIAAFADQVGGSSPTIASSPAGTTWTALTGPTTSTVRLSKWYAVMQSGGNNNVTFSFGSSANARAGAVACFAVGQVAASPGDVNPANTSNGTSTYSAPASGTLAQANEWIVGIFAFAGPSTDNVAVANSYTLLGGGNGAGIGTTGGSAGTNVNIFLEYKVVSATTTNTPQATDATSNRAGVQGTASFKRTGATAGSPLLIVNGSDTAVTLTTATFANPAGLTAGYATSVSYPTGAFGLKSTGSDADTWLYETGLQVAYTPQVAAAPTCVPTLGLFGVSGCGDDAAEHRR